MTEILSQMAALHRNGEAAAKPAFKLFIACESQNAFSKARKIQSQIESLCGGDLQVSRVFWSFSLLRYKQLQKHAAAEAAAAQMVIVATDGNNEIPEAVKSLLENLPFRAGTGRAALVALICPEKGSVSTPEAHAQTAYLRQMAENCGLDFFCNHAAWERSHLAQPAFRPSDSRLMAENILSYYMPWSTGASMNRLKK